MGSSTAEVDVKSSIMEQLHDTKMPRTSRSARFPQRISCSWAASWSSPRTPRRSRQSDQPLQTACPQPLGPGRAGVCRLFTDDSRGACAACLVGQRLQPPPAVGWTHSQVQAMAHGHRRTACNEHHFRHVTSSPPGSTHTSFGQELQAFRYETPAWICGQRLRHSLSMSRTAHVTGTTPP